MWIYAHKVIVVIGWVANESYVRVEDGVIIRAIGHKRRSSTFG